MKLKPLVLLVPLLLSAAAGFARAESDLDEIRGPGLGSEWRLIKNDTRKNIKA